MALSPRAELMLYAAREVQLADEVLRPALGHADVVIADRYLYTAEVLAQAGRDLPSQETNPVLTTAAGGLWPELVFLIDVDPSVARGRRKVAKILAPDRRPVSRKGLTGSGLQTRLRAGYRALAERDSGRSIVVENSDAELDQVVTAIVEAIMRATVDREAAMREVRARLAALAPPASAPPIDGLHAALDAFARLGRQARADGARPRCLRAGRDGRRRSRSPSRRAAPRRCRGSSPAVCVASPTPPPGSSGDCWSNRPRLRWRPR